MKYVTKDPEKTNRSSKRREEREKRARDRRLEPKTAKLANNAKPRYSESLTVKGRLDQNNDQWFFTTRRGVTAVASVDQLMEDAPACYRSLRSQGVPIYLAAMKTDLLRQIDAIKKWKPGVYVAERSGYHRGAHVTPDGTIIGKPRVDHFQVALGDQRLPLAKKGTLKRWQKLVATHAEGQTVFTLALGVGLVGLLLELVPGFPNIGVELTGETSTGKTTALNLSASLWSSPLGPPGSIAVPLRGTVNGIERLMLTRHGSVFLGDEANLFGHHAGDSQRGHLLSELAFMIGEGVEKARYNDPRVRRARFGWLITSNRSMRELLRGEHRDGVDAVLVRLITLLADAEAGLGVYDYLPGGFTSSGSAISALKAGLAADHGHAAPAFIKYLVERRSADGKGLRAEIAKLVASFVKRTHVDPNDGPGLRRAEAFGTIYATLRLATQSKVLPLKRVGQPLLAAYQRAAALRAEDAAELSAFERVEAYVVEHRQRLAGHNRAKKVKLDAAALAAHPGFMAKRKGRKVVLFSTERWNATFGNDARRMLDELQRQNRLQITGKGLQLQVKVRANSDKDRMYAVVLD